MPLTSEQKRRKKVQKELSKFPLKTLKDYEAYNEKARELAVPIKAPPSELHESIKVKFLRRDGMTHRLPLKFYSADIDFFKWVEHGKVYEIPKYIIKQYEKLGIPKYRQVITNAATGESDTFLSHKDPRFAFQLVLD